MLRDVQPDLNDIACRYPNLRHDSPKYAFAVSGNADVKVNLFLRRVLGKTKVSGDVGAHAFKVKPNREFCIELTNRQLKLSETIRLRTEGFPVILNLQKKKKAQTAGSMAGSSRFVESLLLPSKHLRQECRANHEHECECRYVAHVRRSRIALPDSLEQRHRVG
jgi:hypothetical protein